MAFNWMIMHKILIFRPTWSSALPKNEGLSLVVIYSWQFSEFELLDAFWQTITSKYRKAIQDDWCGKIARLSLTRGRKIRDHLERRLSSARGLNSAEKADGKVFDMCRPLRGQRKELDSAPRHTINNNCNRENNWSIRTSIPPAWREEHAQETMLVLILATLPENTKIT